MDIKEGIKKHWFVLILAIFFLFAIVYMASDTLKSDVTGKKTEDGKDVLFSYADNLYTADDLYEELFESFDIGMMIPVIELEIYRDAIEVTKAMKADSQQEATEIITSLKSYYGEEWEKVLNSLLVQYAFVSDSGEKGLVEYLTIVNIRQQIEKEYILANKEIFEEYKEEVAPRMISHILIKMDDPDNPTDEESAKLEEAKTALLKDNVKFSDVAAEYSDDGSKAAGGSLGIVTKESIKNFVKNFQDQVYTKDYNETTEWFKTEYGYHIIKVDATELEHFVALNNEDIFTSILAAKPKIGLDITWDQIQKQQLTFGDNEKINQAIKDHYTSKEEN